MNDLDAIKEWRNGTPPMPAAVEDSVRRGLADLATASSPVPPPRFRTRRAALRTGLAAGLTVAAAGGITVVQSRGDGAPSAEAAEFGDRAARAVEGLPYRRPRPDQWVYTRTDSAGGFDMNTWWKGVDRTITETSEHWKRVDGQGRAFIDSHGKLQTNLTDLQPGGKVTTFRLGGGPLFHLGNYQTLPTDPDALLRRLYAARYPNQAGATGPEEVYEFLTHMLEDPLPPKLQAAIYRALPEVPGVVLRRGVRDQAGRRGDAFAFVSRYGERTNVIIDPVTYRYLGGGRDAARDIRDDDVVARKGTVLDWSARLVLKVVDGPGLR